MLLNKTELENRIFLTREFSRSPEPKTLDISKTNTDSNQKMKYLIIILSFIKFISCFSQDLTITKYEGYDCRIDSTWSGGCENKFIYKYNFINNNRKIKQTEYNEIRIRGEFSTHKVIDSINIIEKPTHSKLFDFYNFSKMMDNIITKNETNTLIGIDPNYFLNEKYIKSHSAIDINDTMSKIKNLLKIKLENYNVSSVIKKKIVEVKYQGELFTFIKSEQNIFWSAYNSKSEKLLFRFVYPEWNIMINNLLKTNRKQKNDLQIIEINEKIKFDIGRTILTQ